jgi:hypothetical protein
MVPWWLGERYVIVSERGRARTGWRRVYIYSTVHMLSRAATGKKHMRRHTSFHVPALPSLGLRTKPSSVRFCISHLRPPAFSYTSLRTAFYNRPSGFILYLAPGDRPSTRRHFRNHVFAASTRPLSCSNHIAMAQRRTHSTKPEERNFNGNGVASKHTQNHDHDHDHDHSHSHSHSIFDSNNGNDSHGHSHDAENIVAALRGEKRELFTVSLSLLNLVLA